ncbi:cyclase family protein [Cryptosporangium phraense]|uniref:Cyclase family protein n=1 Tax=Cryptosporangium phraense TaxID=2593070 RepID=A0A545AQS8_9ACTN|nr:cyclase family protein [Cryptosporangium phraense]TQS43055.1 cyclase family protein [Cryptosporangium phraense]
MPERPAFDDLAGARPPYSSWEYFGNDRGTINFLTPARVAAAAALVRTGEQFGLDYPVGAFEPYPTGTRPPTRHQVFANNEFHRDDWLDSFYLQSTTQIDSLRHIGHPSHGFYGGHSPDESTLGIHNWAGSGIAGRGVLLDVPRYFAAQGRDYDVETTIAFSPDLLDEIAAFQGVEWHGGDLLLLHTGWTANFLAKSHDERVEFTRRNAGPGLAQRESVLRWLWDHEIALTAADNLALEADPVIESDFFLDGAAPPPKGVNHNGMLHRPLIALLGMAVGEMWKLDALASSCAADGRYDFFVTAKPLNIVGGVGSPANAIAFK